MRKVLTLAALAAIPFTSQAQSLWHFSSALSSPWAGSARYMATGGALSSLGNDPSAILDNRRTKPNPTGYHDEAQDKDPQTQRHGPIQ
jgi:hypothetical protein